MGDLICLSRSQTKSRTIIFNAWDSNVRMSGCTCPAGPLPFSCCFSVLVFIHNHRKRLLSLAAQKFVSDIAADAYQHARIRTNATGGRSRAAQPGVGGMGVKVCVECILTHLFPLKRDQDKTRTTLTMDDLSSALAEYGINARKPDFHM